MKRRATILVLVGLAGCTERESRAPAEPTFNRDVAPLGFAKCSPCHHPQGSGPFPLLGYEDFRKRARQIVEVTADRYMPPWLPEGGSFEIDGDRSLATGEIDLFRRWVEGGAVEGDPSDLPSPPRLRDEGWELGEPDLVVEMAPYTLAPEGADVFRNFVVPIPVDATRFVRAFDFRPGNTRAVHHAALLVDETPSTRRLDAKDAEPGIDGMVLGSLATMPDGHFLGWTPGKRPYETPRGMSWILRPRSDLVLQLHMTRTGRAETVQASVAFYFTSEPPDRTPFVVRLGSRRIDVPAGERRYAIRDSYTLPVDVLAFSVYPHAHYLAKEMNVTARLPGGGERRLLRIPDWDFNWQDIFRYSEPVPLPRGTVLSMEFVYDNSEENLRNPHRPPLRVRYGPQSADEMGDLYLELLPERRGEYETLVRDFLLKDRSRQIEELRARLAEAPGDAEARNSLAVVYESLGRFEEALSELRAAVRSDPGLSIARFNLGSLLLSRGSADEAIAHLREAGALDPENAEARVRLGNALRDRGDLAEAERELRDALEIEPEHGWGRYSLALLLQLRGRPQDALQEYERALPLRPEDPELRVSYAAALVGAGREREAVHALEEASRLAPDWVEPRRRLVEIRGTVR